MPRKPVATVPIRPKIVTTVSRRMRVGLAAHAVGVEVFVHVLDLGAHLLVERVGAEVARQALKHAARDVWFETSWNQ